MPNGFGNWKTKSTRVKIFVFEELKDQLEDKLERESYSRTKLYLIKLFGSPERIVSEIAAGLASKRT